MARPWFQEAAWVQQVALTGPNQELSINAIIEAREETRMTLAQAEVNRTALLARKEAAEAVYAQAKAAYAMVPMP